MAFDTVTELPVRLAFLAGALATLTAFGVVMQVLWMRWRGQRRMAREGRIQERWRRPLLQASAKPDVTLPPMHRREALTVVLLWTQLMDSLRGASYARLQQAGRQLGLANVATAWIRKGQHSQALLGIVALGHLGDPAHRSVLLPWLDHERPALSLAAARSLILIDTHDGVARLLQAMPGRADWPLSSVDTLLRLAGLEVADGPLRDLLDAATPVQRVRWMPLMQTMTAPDALALIDAWLSGPAPAELTAAALAQLRDSAGVAHARRACDHEVWWVRVQAAAALGRIGAPEDLAVLTRLLSDPQWWVRMRAAEALVALVMPDQSALGDLWRSLSDPFARDILQQAMAQARLN